VTGCFPTFNYQKVFLVESRAGSKKKKNQKLFFMNLLPFPVSRLERIIQRKGEDGCVDNS
jgi:hypothetical protein